MLKIHPPTKNLIFIPAYVMTDHIFITCCWLVVLHTNMAEMRTRNYKNMYESRLLPPNRFSICLIFMTHYEHITFMTIHCNMEGGWETITSKPNVMVVLVELPTNLRIVQKPSLRCMNIHTTLWLKVMLQSKGLS